jgi:hypothetical protein
MVKVDDLILEGKYFLPGKMEIEFTDQIKHLIRQVMATHSFYPKNELNPFNPPKYLSIAFDLEFPRFNAHYKDRLQKSCGIINNQALSVRIYQKSLRSIRDDVPVSVCFNMHFQQFDGQNGITVFVRSEPAIVFKMRTFDFRPKLDDFDYSAIIDSGRQFITEIMTSCLATEIEAPKTLSNDFFYSNA